MRLPPGDSTRNAECPSQVSSVGMARNLVEQERLRAPVARPHMASERERGGRVGSEVEDRLHDEEGADRDDAAGDDRALQQQLARR